MLLGSSVRGCEDRVKEVRRPWTSDMARPPGVPASPC